MRRPGLVGTKLRAGGFGAAATLVLGIVVACTPPPPGPIPAPPTAVALVRSATISWRAPIGGTVSTYELSWAPGKAIYCRRSPCTWRYLTPGAKYSFKVRALNGAGAGRWSAPSNSVIPLTPPSYRVPLSTLCNLQGSNAYICGSDYGGTIQVGGELFEYVGQTDGFSGAEPPYWDLLVSDPANTCHSMTIRYASADQTSNVGLSTSVEVLQVGIPAVESTTPRGTVGTLSLRLTGSPFTLQGDSSDGAQVFANGFAWCYTPSGT